MPRTLEEMKGAIYDGLRRSFEVEAIDKQRNYPAANAWASGWHPCGRKVALDVAYRHTQPMPEAEQVARQARGSEREFDIRRRLEVAGKVAKDPFEIIGTQGHFTIRAKDGRVIISGKYDFRIRWINHDESRIGRAAEIKAFAPHIIGNAQSVEDLFERRWARHAPYQLLSYCYGTGEPEGFLILDKPGIPHIMPVSLYDGDNMVRMEEWLKKAEEATEAGLLLRDTGDHSILPPYIEDKDECLACPWYGRVCQPDVYHAGAEIGIDPELIDAERTYWAWKGKFRDWEEAQETLKAFARRSEKRFVVVGETMMQKKRRRGPHGSYDVVEIVRYGKEGRRED